MISFLWIPTNYHKNYISYKLTNRTRKEINLNKKRKFTIHHSSLMASDETNRVEFLRTKVIEKPLTVGEKKQKKKIYPFWVCKRVWNVNLQSIFSFTLLTNRNSHIPRIKRQHMIHNKNEQPIWPLSKSKRRNIKIIVQSYLHFLISYSISRKICTLCVYAI